METGEFVEVSDTVSAIFHSSQIRRLQSTARSKIKCCCNASTSISAPMRPPVALALKLRIFSHPDPRYNL